jgi:hypothetical protein
LGFRPSFTPRAIARARPSPVLALISSRSNSARPPSTVSINRPCGVVVLAQVSPRERKPAFRSPIDARTFNRSLVERASRSSRVTITTSPASRTFRSFASSGRSARAPLIFSRKILAQPAPLSWPSWASSDCPSVLSGAAHRDAVDAAVVGRRTGGAAKHILDPNLPAERLAQPVALGDPPKPDHRPPTEWTK